MRAGRGHARACGRARLLGRLSVLAGSAAGSSLVELLICLCVATVAMGLALPSYRFPQREMRARAAARLVSAQFARARMEAVRRSTHVAVEMVGSAPDVGLRLVIDGNANGVRRIEVDAGIDGELQPEVSVMQQFAGVAFAVGLACPGIDGGPAVPLGDAPVKVGASNLLVFTPEATSSGGTVYLTADTGDLFAVRVLGATARVRVLRCRAASGAWEEL